MVAAEEKRPSRLAQSRRNQDGHVRLCVGAWESGRKLQGAVEGPPEGDGHSPEMLAHDLRASGGQRDYALPRSRGSKVRTNITA